ncbi:hypothetical protein N656DRAFT_784703 [Canariomyces notabilis]|uniref:HIT domain-containing protein n=1 Tax=Canariomyces notabilis TaxID=2074819 RepID=A0AAN6QIA3_9PEZI|nr:hypothetical protein N656DRAFT_784703 [Canariomyces arenarius]
MVAVQRVQRMLARQYFTTTPSPSPSSPTSTSITTTTPHLAPAAEPEEGSFNIALQDGPEAGQTVPHVHVHVIPRIRGSTAKPASTPSDAVYERMANEDGNVGGALWDRALRERALNQQGQGQEVESGSAGGDGWEWGSTRPQPGGSFPSIEDAARQARSMAEMEEEAGVYKRLFEIMDAEEREGGRR